MANKITNFLNETKTEVKKVTWPSREEVMGSTVIVLIATAFLGAFCGVFDFIFSVLIRLIIH